MREDRKTYFDDYRIAPLGEYEDGGIIEVHYSHSGLAKGASTPTLPSGAVEGVITLEIVKALTAFTDSVVCLVRQVPDDGQDSPSAHTQSEDGDRVYLLKLYDRRQANTTRDPNRCGLGLWTERLEKRYQGYIHRSKRLPPKFFRHGNNWDKPYWERRGTLIRAKLAVIGKEASELTTEEYHALSTEEEHTAIVEDCAWLSESYVEHDTNNMFLSEQSVYRELHRVREEPPIPRYLGQVAYHSRIGEVNGLLLEYIPNSVTVRQYLEAVAPCGYSAETASRLCHEAAAFFRKFSLGFPVLQCDPRTENVLVQLDGTCKSVLLRKHVQPRDRKSVV